VTLTPFWCFSHSALDVASKHADAHSVWDSTQHQVYHNQQFTAVNQLKQVTVDELSQRINDDWRHCLTAAGWTH